MEASLYRSSTIVTLITATRLRWHIARIGKGRCVFKILTAESIEKRPLGKPRLRW